MALCLLSCSHSGQDDPFIPDSSESGIAFGGNSGNWQEAGSRAWAQTGSRADEGETGLETLFSSFRVWGYKTKTDALRDGGNGTDGHQEDGNGTAAIQKVMEGYLVDWNATDKAWEYIGKQNPFLKLTQTIKYWDYSASSYRFMAYAYNDKTTKVTASTDASLSTTVFKIPYAFCNDATSTTTPYISELWVSNNQSTGQNKYGEQVKLTFAPLIAKVRFKFKYADGQKPKIEDISFKDSRWNKNADGSFNWTAQNEPQTPREGNIVISYSLSEAKTTVSKPWGDGKTGPLELTIPYEEETDPIHQTDTYQKWYYMPPMDIADYKQGSYTITAKVNGNPVSATVGSEYTQWKAGCQYTYTFKISETNTSISFAEVQVERWVESGVLDNNGNGTKDW